MSASIASTVFPSATKVRTSNAVSVVLPLPPLPTRAILMMPQPFVNWPNRRETPRMVICSRILSLGTHRARHDPFHLYRSLEHRFAQSIVDLGTKGDMLDGRE